MYGKHKQNNVNQVRYNIVEHSFALKQSSSEPFSGIESLNLASLRPCSDVLLDKIRRANLVAWVWTHAVLPNPHTSDPTQNGYEI